MPPELPQHNNEEGGACDVVFVDAVKCDLEVLFIIAALLGFPRRPVSGSRSTLPLPAPGERMRYEHWPLEVSAAEVLFVVLHLALPQHLDVVASPPATS